MVVRSHERPERLDQNRLDQVFGALADPTRRDILARVLKREESVSSLADRYPMSFAAVQRHVAVLERAGLVTKQSQGRERLVRGHLETTRLVNRLLDQYEDIWRGRVARIDALLEGSTAHPTTRHRKTRSDG